MIMGIWRDLAALALLAHLVTLTTGNLAGEVEAFEKLLARNVSIVVIDGETGGPVNLNELKNVTNSTTGDYNSTVGITNSGRAVDEKKLVVELEEALVSAASSGRVLLVEPSDNESNATVSLPGPLLVIETTANASASLNEDPRSRKNEKLRVTGPSSDLEIAQSQIRPKTTSRKDYADDDDLENFEHLLAMTEYESQKIDTKSIDEESFQVRNDELKSTPQSTSPPRAEETHYDVPKRKNLTKNQSRKIDDFTQTHNEELDEASTENQDTTSDSNPAQSVRETTFGDPPEREFARKRPHLSSKFNGKPLPIDEEIFRGGRNSKILVALATNPSAPRNFTHDDAAKRNRLPASSSSVYPTSTFVPVSSKNTDARLKNIQNFRNIVLDSSRKNFNSNPIQTIGASSISTKYPLSRQRSLATDRTTNRPNQLTSSVPRASKRIDDYSNVDDLAFENENFSTSNDERIEYPTGYDRSPSLTRQIPKARLYPVVSDHRQADATGEQVEENRSDYKDSSEEINPTISRTAVSADDLYENGGQTTSYLSTTEKPASVHYRKVHRNDLQGPGPSDDYQEDRRTSIVKKNPSYNSYGQNAEVYSVGQESEEVRSRNVGHPSIGAVIYPRKFVDGNSPGATTTILPYESYDEHVKKTSAGKRPERILNLVAGNSQIRNPIYSGKFLRENSLVASTTIPLHESYDEPREESPAGQRPKRIRNFEAGNPQTRNAIYSGKFLRENSLVASTTIPPYESYDEHVKRTPVSKRPERVRNFESNNSQTRNPIYSGKFLRENSLVATTTIPAYESYDEHREETPAGQRPERVRSFEAGNSQTRNQINSGKFLRENSLVATTTIPPYESYDEHREETPVGQRPERARNFEAGNPQTRNPIYSGKFLRENSLVATTTIPPYESYDEHREETPVGQRPERVRNSEAGNPQTRSEIYPRKFSHDNLPAAATTILPYATYKDDESPDPSQRPHAFIPIKHHQHWTTKNPLIVPHKQAYRLHGYASRSAQSVTPTNSLTVNPIYQIHDVKTNPGYIVANVIHDPRKNYRKSGPTTATRNLDDSTASDLSRRTTFDRSIVTATSSPDSYEDDTETPIPTTRRSREPNDADNHNSDNLDDDYRDDSNDARPAVSVPTRKQNSEYDSNESLEQRYSRYPTKASDESSRAGRVDARTTGNFATAESAIPAYVVNSKKYDNNFNDDTNYVGPATKLRTANRLTRLERNNRKYESGKNVNDEDVVTPSGGVKSIDFDGADYGNRVRPRVVSAGNKNVAGFRSRAEAKQPDRSRDVETNYEDRGRVFVNVDEEPVEPVNRADADEARYEDAVSENSENPEHQATQLSHAKAVQSGGGKHEHEEGGGVKHDEDHHEAHGEKGEKGYKDYHEYDKGEKGHHDKESHDKEYDEKKGDKKKHEDESSYHKEHHHGEKGDKEAEFAEKGEHQKGHSTKGQHVVHKKDEYEKKTEFYDESHEEDGDEKEGEYHHEHESKKGGHEKKGHHESAHHHDEHGEKGEHEKGHHYHEKKGHDGKDGKDEEHQHHEKYGKKGGHEEGLKWSHKKGDGGGKKKGS